jgi:hypothetical protein
MPIAIGIGGRPVITGQATDAFGNKKTIAGTNWGDITRGAAEFGNAGGGYGNNYARPSMPGASTGGGRAIAGGGYGLGGNQANVDFYNESARQSQAIQAARNGGAFGGTANQKNATKTVFNTVPAAVPGAPGTGSLGGAGGGGVPGVIMPGANAITSQTENQLSKTLTQPGISDATTQQIVNKQVQRLNANRGADKVAAREAALAAGMGESGAAIQNGLDIDNDYNVKTSALENDIRTGIAEKNAGLASQAISQGLQYTGMQQANANAAADRDYRERAFAASEEERLRPRMLGTSRGVNTDFSGWSSPGGNSGPKYSTYEDFNFAQPRRR